MPTISFGTIVPPVLVQTLFLKEYPFLSPIPPLPKELPFLGTHSPPRLHCLPPPTQKGQSNLCHFPLPLFRSSCSELVGLHAFRSFWPVSSCGWPRCLPPGTHPPPPCRSDPDSVPPPLPFPFPLAKCPPPPQFHPHRSPSQFRLLLLSL